MAATILLRSVPQVNSHRISKKIDKHRSHVLLTLGLQHLLLQYLGCVLPLFYADVPQTSLRLKVTFSKMHRI